MTQLKLLAAFSDTESAGQFAATADGVLFTSTSESTAHLPFAALFVGATEDLASMHKAADIGVCLASERTMKNKPLSLLAEEELPVAAGLFAMVANAETGTVASDRYWRDKHAPLALEIHTVMTHYYQFAILHRFSGPDWNGIAACCAASESDLRERFYSSADGESRIAADVRQFADVRNSPRRVISETRRFNT